MKCFIFVEGELLIRYCLQDTLRDLGVHVTVIKSDEEFDLIKGDDYDFIIMDPWTWAGSGS